MIDWPIQVWSGNGDAGAYFVGLLLCGPRYIDSRQPSVELRLISTLSTLMTGAPDAAVNVYEVVLLRRVIRWKDEDRAVWLVGDASGLCGSPFFIPVVEPLIAEHGRRLLEAGLLHDQPPKR